MRAKRNPEKYSAFQNYKTPSTFSIIWLYQWQIPLIFIHYLHVWETSTLPENEIIFSLMSGVVRKISIFDRSKIIRPPKIIWVFQTHLVDSSLLNEMYLTGYSHRKCLLASILFPLIRVSSISRTNGNLEVCYIQRFCRFYQHYAETTT